MTQYISKSALVAEIERRISEGEEVVKSVPSSALFGLLQAYKNTLSFINSLEVKEVDLIIHTIIAECCDWLAMNTNLSHDEIEGCRNLMLTVKDKQFKAQKGE